MRTHRPMRPDSLLWRCFGLIYKTGAAGHPEVVAGERSESAVINEILSDAVGPEPDLEERENLLELVTYIAFTVGAGASLLAIFSGVLIDFLAGSELAVLTARVITVGVAAPFLGLTMVWAFRWTFARRDLARKRRPSQLSQPGNRDLLYAAPIAALFGVFFALV
ncbi:hypothetical protein [Cellulomonas bogoriensis]